MSRNSSRVICTPSTSATTSGRSAMSGSGSSSGSSAASSGGGGVAASSPGSALLHAAMSSRVAAAAAASLRKIGRASCRESEYKQHRDGNKEHQVLYTQNAQRKLKKSSRYGT